MANFETFHRSMLSLARDPTITVHKARLLSLNGSSFLALGSPAAVALLFDRESRTIGLRPAQVSDPECSFVRRAAQGPNGPFVISAMAFMRYYEIRVSRTLRWPAHLEDGQLCINLNEPAQPVARRATPGTATKLSVVAARVDDDIRRESNS